MRAMRQKSWTRVLVALAVALIALGSISPSFAAEATEAAAGADEPERLIPAGNLLNIVRAGGVLMIPIIACSFVMVAFVFERFISLRRGRVLPGPFVKRFLHQIREGELSPGEALAVCLENRSAVAEVFAAAVRKWGRPAVEVEQAILDAGERAANGLRKHIRVLNGVATVSPLLGLLGTVCGMITAFNTIAQAQAMGKPELLASGIAEALITTAAGLMVAIPALILYLIFLSRVDQLIIEIDALGQEVIGVIAAEGSRPVSKKSPRAARQDLAA
jgi:biopolymer transport protein ExbB